MIKSKQTKEIINSKNYSIPTQTNLYYLKK